MHKLINSTLLLIVSAAILSGCKTQSQIRREQQLENLTRQVSEGQRVAADRTIQISEMQERINQLQGALEEQGYAEEIQRQESLTDIRTKIDSLEKTQKTILDELEQNRNQMNSQRAYLDQVLETLRQISEGDPITNQSTDAVYNEGLRHYRATRYEESRPYFMELISRGVEGQTLAHAYHNLAMVEYIGERNENAIVYFGRLFTEFPDSGYNRNGLLFLAKTFERTGQKAQARQTLQQLINRFPEANRINDAKKMLERLK